MIPKREFAHPYWWQNFGFTNVHIKVAFADLIASYPENSYHQLNAIRARRFFLEKSRLTKLQFVKLIPYLVYNCSWCERKATRRLGLKGACQRHAHLVVPSHSKWWVRAENDRTQDGLAHERMNMKKSRNARLRKTKS